MATSWITGVYVRADYLEWTVLRRVKESWEQVDQGCIALPRPDSSDAARRPIIFKQAMKHLKGWVAVGVSTRQTLCRVAMLPSVDADELRGMTELQVDKFSPFPIENMSVGAEVLALGEASSLVAMMAVKRDAVEDLGQMFVDAGGYPDAVDVDIMGWLWLLRQAGKIPAIGPKGFLIAGNDTLDWVVVRDGALLKCQSLEMMNSDEDRQEWVSELMEDMAFSFTMLETEWGGLGKIPFEIWHDPTQAMDDVAKRLEGMSELTSVSVHTLEELPPLSEGLARRAAEPVEPLHLDVLPEEWRAVETSRLFMRRFWQVSAGFVAIWFLVVCTFAVLLRMERGGIAHLQTEVETLEGPALEVGRMRGKVLEFGQYADRSRSALECLRVISIELPAGADLTSFIYRKGNTLTLRGESDETDKIYQFNQAMEREGIFTEVKSDGINTRPGGRSQFGVTLRLPGIEDEVNE